MSRAACFPLSYNFPGPSRNRAVSCYRRHDNHYLKINKIDPQKSHRLIDRWKWPLPPLQAVPTPVIKMTRLFCGSDDLEHFSDHADVKKRDRIIQLFATLIDMK